MVHSGLVVELHVIRRYLSISISRIMEYFPKVFPNLTMDSQIPSNIDPRKIHRRKKTRRSCLGCQRSHRTCNDERPCDTCVRRGMDYECSDGIRKKPKYLEGERRTQSLQSQLQSQLQSRNSPSVQDEHIKGQNITQTQCVRETPWQWPGTQRFVIPGEYSLHRREALYWEQSFLENASLDSLDALDGLDALDELLFSVEHADADTRKLGFTINTGWSGTFFPE